LLPRLLPSRFRQASVKEWLIISKWISRPPQLHEASTWIHIWLINLSVVEPSWRRLCPLCRSGLKKTSYIDRLFRYCHEITQNTDIYKIMTKTSNSINIIQFPTHEFRKSWSKSNQLSNYISIPSRYLTNTIQTPKRIENNFLISIHPRFYWLMSKCFKIFYLHDIQKEVFWIVNTHTAEERLAMPEYLTHSYNIHNPFLSLTYFSS